MISRQVGWRDGECRDAQGSLGVHHLSARKLPTLVHAGMVWSFFLSLF